MANELARAARPSNCGPRGRGRRCVAGMEVKRWFKGVLSPRWEASEVLFGCKPYKDDSHDHSPVDESIHLQPYPLQVAGDSHVQRVDRSRLDRDVMKKLFERNIERKYQSGLCRHKLFANENKRTISKCKQYMKNHNHHFVINFIHSQIHSSQFKQHSSVKYRQKNYRSCFDRDVIVHFFRQETERKDQPVLRSHGNHSQVVLWFLV